jgi:hypothetical protein
MKRHTTPAPSARSTLLINPRKIFFESLATELIVCDYSADFIDNDRIYITAMSALHILTATQFERKLACR